MIYLADLSGLIFLATTGMIYASWKMYWEQEDPSNDPRILTVSTTTQEDEIPTDALQR